MALGFPAAALRACAGDEVGLLLDGAYRGRVRLRRKRGRVFVSLPTYTLARELDLLDPENGRSILGKSCFILPCYAFGIGTVTFADRAVVGGFSVSGLDDQVQVDCLENGHVLMRGFARRVVDARYRFSLPFPRMLTQDRPAACMFRIAGLPLDGPPLLVTMTMLGVRGHVDPSRAGEVAGWVCDLNAPERRVAVDLVRDGVVVQTVMADRPRADLLAAGIGDGQGGFSFTLPRDGSFSEPTEISVVLSGTALNLVNSPLAVSAPPAVRGVFDRLHGMSAHGWALNLTDPKRPVEVEAVCGERVLARATANLFRGDLLEAGLNDGFCAYKIDLGEQMLDLLGQEIVVRVAGRPGMVLEGAPRIATQNPNLLRYLKPGRGLDPSVLPRLRRALDRRVGALVLSIIMPVHDTPQEWLVRAVESVLAQWCGHWELICVDDRSTAPHVAAVLGAFARRDRRIRVLASQANGGIARATNLGLRAACGDYVTFLDHDDCLEPDAVYHLLKAARDSDADFIYSDEATTDENIDSIAEIKARPAFSYDYYLSHPYFVHMLCIRRRIAYEIGGWDEGMAISADVDFVLRALGRVETIAHVPRVLYRWRTHGGSAGHSRQDAVMQATRGAIQRHLDRHHPGATVSDGAGFNQFRVDWPAARGRILIVIPTKNKADLVRAAIESIERTARGEDYRIVVVDHESTDPEAIGYFASLGGRHVVMPYRGDFNYSRINNQAVRKYGGDAEFVLFLNNDVEATSAGWLDRMRRLANRPEVGVVGALLLYPDRRVQHAGVILGFNGSADHAFKFGDVYGPGDARVLGYNCSLTSVRDFSAVTAACMMMRRAVFEQVGGFDESFKIGFNDTDLCLRVREAGFKVLYDGHTVLYHYESATRSVTKQVMHPEDTRRMLERHAGILRDGDPFYNPNLSVTVQDHVLRDDDGCGRGAVRVVGPTKQLWRNPAIEGRVIP
ncbi:glycosyltransferase family 2 protein [Gluconacetobacter sacchari]|uniref:Glycosyltransferase family 2 protein n=2 Tax=Gluconacetobacter sacchari TaxID=92759 RepID=A0A7W4IE80_9PROT|nr:glycosyltransferase family 2 protein [Gluconacetobacter sacchari]